MRMGMHQRGMAMSVAVPRARLNGLLMFVLMVRITVVAMLMRVLEWRVNVGVLVLFTQVQPDSECHEQSRACQR